MSRAILVGVAVVAMLATAGRGLSGDSEHRHDNHAASAAVAAAAAQSAEAPIYYQHPDGKPLYSLTPKTDAGRPRVSRGAARVPISVSTTTRCAAARAGSRRRVRPQHQILPQSDGTGRHLAGAEEGLDGDGLHPGL